MNFSGNCPESNPRNVFPQERRKKKRRRSRRRKSAAAAAFRESGLSKATIGRGLYTEEDLLSDILSVDGYDSLGQHLYLFGGGGHADERVVAHYRSEQWKGPVVVDYRSVERGVIRNLVLPPPYHYGYHAHGPFRRQRPAISPAVPPTPQVWTYSADTAAAADTRAAKKEIKLNVVNPGSVADLPRVTTHRPGGGGLSLLNGVEEVRYLFEGIKRDLFAKLS